jgi:non-heme chloroperoxidase
MYTKQPHRNLSVMMGFYILLKEVIHLVYVNPSKYPVPELQPYATRSGSELYYRYYPSAAETATTIILLHGISEDSKYLYPYAQKVSSTGLAHIFTPDLRGYGPKAARLGDIDYIGQLEDDLADLVQYIKAQLPHVTRIVMAGHSAGGAVGIKRWHGLTALELYKRPEEMHDGQATKLSFRLLLSRSPMKYKRDLAKLMKPTLVLVGAEDEVFLCRSL